MTTLVLSTILSLSLCGTGVKMEQTFAPTFSGQASQLSNSIALINQRVTFRTYQNARYNYAIAYPSTLAPQGESDNGDGQAFRSHDGTVELRVWGSHNISNQTLKEAYAEAIAEIGSTGGGYAKYKFLGRDFFVVSGPQGGRIIYQKTIFRGDVIKTFRIEYPMASQATYDAITARVSRSFKG